MPRAARSSSRTAAAGLPPAPEGDEHLQHRREHAADLERVARTAENAARRARTAANQARSTYEDELRLHHHYGGLPLEGLTP